MVRPVNSDSPGDLSLQNPELTLLARDSAAAAAPRAERGILRKTGIDVLGDIPWGTHLCQFYKTREDLTDILSPYFSEGLKSGEFCMWIVSEPLTKHSAEDALRKRIPSLERYLEIGQIEIIPYDHWYTPGGSFDSHKVLNGWVSRLSRALAEGYEGMRLSGDTFWLEKHTWEDFQAYEEKIDGIISGCRMIALCTYPLNKCGATDILSVVRHHQYALTKREGSWELIENSKKILSALQENELHYRSLFTAMTEGFALHEIICDEKGEAVDYRFLDINPAFEKETGLKREDVAGRLKSAVLPGDDPHWLRIYGKVALTGEPVRFENYSSALGRYYEVFSYSLGPRKFATLFTDITRRKQTEILNLALDNINGIIHSTLNFDEIMNSVVSEAAAALGFETAAVSLRIAGEWIVGYTYGFKEDIVGLRVSDEGDPHALLAIRTGRIVTIQDAYRDERVNAARMETWGIRSVMVVPLMVQDQTLGVIFFNQHSCAFSFSELHTGFAKKLAASVSLAVRNAQLFEKAQEELAERKRVGRELRESRAALQKANLELEERIRERTKDLRQAAVMLEEQKEILQSIIDNIPVMLTFYDAEGRIRLVNNAFERILGWSMDEAQGIDLLSFCAPETTGKEILDGTDSPFIHEKNIDCKAIFDRVKADGKAWTGRRTMKKAAGDILEVNVSISPVLGASGEAINYVAVIQDITQEILLQRQLSQTQKMEAIGTLAGGIAHDLKNIFTPILINTEIALEDLDEDSPVRPLMKEALDATMLGIDLVKQIVTFSRRVPLVRKPVLVSSIVKEGLGFIRSSLPATIEIRYRLKSTSSMIMADPTQIKQVMINLGSNAAYAMRDKGGILEIGLDNVNLDAGTAALVSSDLAPGAYVRITVRDTGTGMDEKTAARVFEPFFTTKKGEGTGMGLAVVHGIVKDHHGSVSVRSNPGKGTTFTVYLPKMPDETV